MSDSVKLDSNVVQLILKGVNFSDEIPEEEFASIVTRNPMITWAKFVLTDDKPNKNKVTVPQTEFDNIISSGVNMPLKMALENIGDYHDGAIPIGVITNLKKFKNQIIGLAALWNRERPEDVAMLKEKYNSEEQINISWELACNKVKNEDGSSLVENASLKAATIVGLPAYAGRTPIVAMAANNKQEDNILDELDKIKKQLSDVEQERDNLKTEVTELKSSVDEFKALQKEVEDLRKFKQEVEAELQKEERFASLKNKFVEAGIEKDEEYFVTNREKLLAMPEDALEFMLQEMVSFAPNSEEASEQKSKAPNFKTGGAKEEKSSPRELAQALLRRKQKEN